jgi:hypothetical protein
MAQSRNEPNAPPSKKQRGRIRSGWFVLIVLAIVIIAAIAMIADRPGAGMGGSLSREGGTTPPPAQGAP